MTQKELNIIYDKYKLLFTDEDSKLKSIVRYYLEITKLGGHTVHYTLESNDTAKHLIYHLKQCGITVLDDPAFIDSKTEFCVFIFY